MKINRVVARRKFTVLLIVILGLIGCLSITFSANGRGCYFMFTFPTNQSLTSFAGTNVFDPNDLVLKAKQSVEQSIGDISKAQIGLTQADLICKNNVCNLQRLSSSINVTPSLRCLINPYPPENSFTEILFFLNTEKNLVKKHIDTFPGQTTQNLAWEDASISFAKVIDITLANLDSNFRQQHSEFYLGITWNEERWKVYINDDLTGMNPVEFSFQIDPNSGQIHRD